MEQTGHEVGQAQAAHQPDIFAPDVVMVILTWVSFAALLFILKRFAWQPILKTLNDREAYIKQSIEDADKAKASLVDIHKEKERILEQAKSDAVKIVQDARKAADLVAQDIEKKAKEHAQSIIAGGQAQVLGEYQRASKQLKQESARVSIALASRILKENVDTAKNNKLIEETLNTL